MSDTPKWGKWFEPDGTGWRLCSAMFQDRTAQDALDAAAELTAIAEHLRANEPVQVTLTRADVEVFSKQSLPGTGSHARLVAACREALDGGK